MAVEWLEIQIVGWDKYNPRADRGGFSWFRMDNQFYMHMRQRKGCSADAAVLMAFLLAECSAVNGAAFKMRLDFASEMLGRTVKNLESALLELQNQGDIFFKRLEAASTLTDGRTDETDRTERDETNVCSGAVATLPQKIVKPSSIPVWESYRAAFEKRYGTVPLRNAKTNSVLSQFVARMPIEEAPLVAEFFLGHNDQFYVKQMHSVGIMLKDAEKLYAEWKRGRKMTTTEAKSAESMDHYQSQMDRLKRGEL